MHKSVRKLVAILLLLAVPLQGLAAVLMPFHCVTDDHLEAATVGAQQHHQGATPEHDERSPATAHHDGDTSSKDAGNLCCNHVCTSVPSVTIFAAPDMPFVYENHVSVIPALFFPEQFLRPPRA